MLATTENLIYLEKKFNVRFIEKQLWARVRAIKQAIACQKQEITYFEEKMSNE